MGLGANFVIREVAPGADRAEDAIEKILAGAGGDVDAAGEGAGCFGSSEVCLLFCLGVKRALLRESRITQGLHAGYDILFFERFWRMWWWMEECGQAVGVVT